jgi:phage terminase small subunit
MHKLTPRQQRFIAEYVKDLNGTQAAIRAGYSERSAAEQAYQLLQKTSVQKPIEDLLL